MAERICVAQIGAAHGVRGEVKLWPFTADPLAVQSYGALESEDGTRRFEIEALRPAKGHLVARISGVADREAAEQLTNLKLYVSRDRLPPVDGRRRRTITPTWSDSPPSTADGTRLGTVIAIHNFGAGDIVEITPETGGETLLVPFTDAAVPEIDIAGRAHRWSALPPATE